MDSYLLKTSSPTLTNPDMILPYGDHESPTTDGAWPGTINEIEFSRTSTQPSLSLLIPSTPIYYINKTLLSDIGEVTEAEAEGTPIGHNSAGTEKDIFGISPTKIPSRPILINRPECFAKRKNAAKHRRQASDQTVSSLSPRSQFVGNFKDAEDNVSVDDSVFQGDDEESDITTDDEPTSPESRRVVMGSDKVEYNENTSAALSKRAERILYEAKKRLNNMEGNLNRARTSKFPKYNCASYSDQSSSSISRSTPSPTQYESPKIESMGAKVSRVGQLAAPFESINDTPSDSGNYTDILPLNTNLSRFMWPEEPESRSHRESESYSSTRSSEDWKSSPRSFTPPAETPPSDPLETFIGHADHLKPEVDRFSNKQDPGENCNQDGEIRAPSRSTSSLQMRQIQSHMEDLKDRLSALRERTKDNILRHRSQRSLRTPSPFIAAETTCGRERDYDRRGSLNTDSERVDRSVYSHKEGNKEIKIEEISSSSNKSLRNEKNSSENMNHSLSSKCEINEQSLEASDEELESFYDPQPSGRDGANCSPKDSIWQDEDSAVSHEDREDAFDYQNIFLHSALGTLSQQRRHSVHSDDSGETERGFNCPAEDKINPRWGLTKHQTKSTDTLSTIESFATATESYEKEDNNKNFEANDFAVQSLKSTVPEIGPLNDRLHHRYWNKNKFYETNNATKHSISKSSHRVKLSWQSSHRSSSPTSPFKQTDNIIHYSLKTEMSKRQHGKTMFAIYETYPPGSASSSKDSEYCKEMSQKKGNFNNLPVLSPVDILSKDDEILLSQLLDSLGESVLSLKESKMGCDVHVWRRRIDTARRVLDGSEVET